MSEFRFYKSGDELVVTSEIDESFEERINWYDEWSITDEDLHDKVTTAFENQF
jgi:hypothetical protein